ncbi:MAG: sulfotransferase [Candidatus Parcubacteria bacterium]|nr:sulfotransferase [Burkholderiales bacterium]
MLDFLGIGAQKAGTSWLYEALLLHPELRFPARKEVHFWDQKRARGLDWYRALFAGGAPGVRNGEITPAYSFLPRAVVAEIRELNPALRIFYLLRNPMERAWSSALMALQRAELTIGEASDQWFIDHFRSAGSLARGDYEACLRTWRGVFGNEAVLVIRYEDVGRSPRAFVEAVCSHIGVDPGHCAQIPDAKLAQRVFAGLREPVRESLLPVLREIYLPRISSLERYLGEDLHAWRGTAA